jgi:heme-degrading monooxygenase HmoA
VAATASTPEPPYVAVIFTSVRSDDLEGYADVEAELDRLAVDQPGFLGVETAGGALGITVSYWASDDDARAWKGVAEHRAAQVLGRERWYRSYQVRVATVTRAYGVP